ncbi:MAG: MFS transporter [Anaerolineae bacterium]
MIGTLMEVIDTSVANVSLPHMQGTFSAGTDEITWVITSYLVANAIILPLSGWLGNYFGRKRAYLTCLAVFTLASVGSGAAMSLPMLVGMRVLQGLAGGAFAPMSQAILLESFPKKEHGKATQRPRLPERCGSGCRSAWGYARSDASVRASGRPLCRCRASACCHRKTARKRASARRSQLWCPRGSHPRAA